MKTIKKFISMFVAIVIMALIIVGCEFADFALDNQNLSIENNEQVFDNQKASNNTCCPPGWTLIDDNEFPEDPALKWDVNGDGFLCFKGEWLGDETPNGNGNDPLFTQSNVKDNNNPCKP
jgi:hypothetical protein